MNKISSGKKNKIFKKLFDGFLSDRPADTFALFLRRGSFIRGTTYFATKSNFEIRDRRADSRPRSVNRFLWLHQSHQF